MFHVEHEQRKNTQMTSTPNVPRATKIYLDELLKWQKSVNLISKNTVGEAWERHFEDSLQLISLLPEAAKTLIDLGSGAGFPGLVLAMETDLDVTLVESDRKKCEFLKHVGRTTKTPVTVLCERIENVPAATYDVITSRALADLKTLLGYAYPFCQEETVLLLHKGQGAQDEIKDAQQKWNFDCDMISSTVSGSGFILVIRGLTHIMEA